MSAPAIVVENLGKEYQIGAREDGYTTFREALTDLAMAPLKRFHALSGQVNRGQCFWALKDICLEVQPGEVVGIIGPNGAGKSTLLKVLSRIAEPTEGRAIINGRVASLLEVGTGFHPELTGRENIYLNGSILGMSRREIHAKFDEIVDFSGVERFLDTPVKRFSSGMKIRLGFAVAAHLQPEILIVDEVLAVGDAEFQSRCVGKLDDVARSGRTVLFVSHNMAAVEVLCTRAILLECGRIVDAGEVAKVVDGYLRTSETCAAEADLTDHSGRRPGMVPIVKKLTIRDAGGRPIGSIPPGSDVTFELELDPPEAILDAFVSIRISARRGERVTTLNSYWQFPRRLDLCDKMQLSCQLRKLPLAPGRYNLEIVVGEQGKIHDQVAGLSMEVIPMDVFGTGRLPPAGAGYLLPHVTWDEAAVNPSVAS